MSRDSGGRSTWLAQGCLTDMFRRVNRLPYIIATVVLLFVATPSGVAYGQSTDKDCSDFLTRIQAQQALDSRPGDPWNLDADGDGEACEFYREKQVNFWIGGMIGVALGGLLWESSRKKNYGEVAGMVVLAGFPVLFLTFGAGWVLPPALSPGAVGVLGAVVCGALAWLVYGRVESGQWPWEHQSAIAAGEASPGVAFVGPPASSITTDRPRATIDDRQKMSTFSVPQVVPSAPPLRQDDPSKRLAEDCIALCTAIGTDLDTLCDKFTGGKPTTEGERSEQHDIMSSYAKAVDDLRNRAYELVRDVAEDDLDRLKDALTSLSVHLQMLSDKTAKNDSLGWEVAGMTVDLAETRSIAGRLLGGTTTPSPTDVEALARDLSQRLTTELARTSAELGDLDRADPAGAQLDWNQHFRVHAGLLSEMTTLREHAQKSGLAGLADSLEDAVDNYRSALDDLFERTGDGALIWINDVIDDLDANAVTSTGYREKERQRVRGRLSSMTHQLARDLTMTTEALVLAPSADDGAFTAEWAARLEVHQRHQTILEEIAAIIENNDPAEEFELIDQLRIEHEGIIEHFDLSRPSLTMMYISDCKSVLQDFDPSTRSVLTEAEARLNNEVGDSARRVVERLTEALSETVGNLETAEHSDEESELDPTRALADHESLQHEIEILREVADRAGQEEIEDFLSDLSSSHELFVGDLAKSDLFGIRYFAESMKERIAAQQGHL